MRFARVLFAQVKKLSPASRPWIPEPTSIMVWPLIWLNSRAVSLRDGVGSALGCQNPLLPIGINIKNRNLPNEKRWVCQRFLQSNSTALMPTRAARASGRFYLFQRGMNNSDRRRTRYRRPSRESPSPPRRGIARRFARQNRFRNAAAEYR